MERAGRSLPAARILLDSTRVPKGYGSSAATAVALAGALLAASGAEASRDEVFALALAAHRAFQGGRGSGYDVATSTYGGVGLFRGGAVPTWRPIEADWMPELRLVRGAGAVKTPGAIGRYESWKRRSPDDARLFLRDSNDAVEALARASSWEDALWALQETREIGVAVGDLIGVHAWIERVEGSLFTKAVGAGAELAVAVGGREGEPVERSGEGLVIEGGREE
jgi:phosphomevalonate kinase